MTETYDALMAMGFPADQVAEAIETTGSRDTFIVLDWLLANPHVDPPEAVLVSQQDAESDVDELARVMSGTDDAVDLGDVPLEVDRFQSDPTRSVYNLPTPVTTRALSFLPPLALLRARHVCVEWGVAGGPVLYQLHPEVALRVQEYMESQIHRQDARRVCVAIRVRPPPPDDPPSDCVRVLSRRVIEVDIAQSGRTTAGRYHFDYCLGPNTTQVAVAQTLKPRIMRSVMRGEDVCVFAYGQTGSGKTHTVFGDSGEEVGLAPRLCRSACHWANEADRKLHITFIEIYNEHAYDLLGDGKEVPLKEKRAGTVVPEGIIAVPATTAEEIRALLERGAGFRRLGKTVCNQRSSRSHAIATLHFFTPKDFNAPPTPTREPAVSARLHPTLRKEEPSSPAFLRGSRLHLIDLAGSERAGRHAVNAHQLTEGCNINKSLTTLGRVISSLALGKGECPPYRDSMLTWLLRESLVGGRARSFMVACLHSSGIHKAENASTLRYATQYSALRSTVALEIQAAVSDLRVTKATLMRLKHDLPTDPRSRKLRSFQELVDRIRDLEGAVVEKQKHIAALQNKLKRQEEQWLAME